MVPEAGFGQRLRVVGFEHVDSGTLEERPGVVLEPGDVVGRTDGGDVAIGVGRIDNDERIVERFPAVLFGIEFDRWLPVGDGGEQRSKAAVLDDEQFGEVAAKAPRTKVAPVGTDAFQELFGEPNVGCQLVVQPLL